MAPSHKKVEGRSHKKASTSPFATPCCRSFPMWMQLRQDAPTRLYIPKIGVNANVEHIALQTEADRDTPYSWWDVAWYSKGTLPGAPGMAFIYGHLDSTTAPAIFWNLDRLRPGDRLTVAYHHHGSVKFAVVSSRTYWDNQVPLGLLTKPTPDHLLMLMTCAGTFYQGTGYDHRLIVLAKQISG